MTDKKINKILDTNSSLPSREDINSTPKKDKKKRKPRKK